MEVPGLLHSATDLVPVEARSDADLSKEHVREYLRHDEWEIALGILQDFDGIQWQSVEYWNLLAAAAQQMWLEHDAAWCLWRRAETRCGAIIKATLQLIAPEVGGRRRPLPATRDVGPQLAHGCPNLAPRSAHQP
ncbi:hypothetical protein, partial [Nocardia sp. NPDC050710]|uniref:hypothetical protein n=1 Tax=Nocardia sp. NPDC050710 TaxID=3157220 RepID=UPI0033E16AC5